MPDLDGFPKPAFSVGLAAVFDRPLFLSHVVAWHVDWLEEGLVAYQKKLIEHLHLEDRFLSHVTIARKPCDEPAWKKAFFPLPLYVKNLHLYESLGNSHYKSVWEHAIQAPFEEIEHTADLAFLVRPPHFLHAQLALAFYFPAFIRYLDHRKVEGLEAVVQALNAMIAKVDGEIGCPLKAISFHGVETRSEEWEMIVDV